MSIRISTCLHQLSCSMSVALKDYWYAAWQQPERARRAQSRADLAAHVRASSGTAGQLCETFPDAKNRVWQCYCHDLSLRALFAINAFGTAHQTKTP